MTVPLDPFQDVAFVGKYFGSVKKLRGFKTSHRVPKEINGATERFVANIGEEDLGEHADQVLRSLRSELSYGIKDIDRSLSGSSAELKTRDFDVNLSLSQDSDEADTFVIKTEVTNFRNPAVVATDEFSQAVANFVDSMELQVPAKFDLEDLIGRLEKSPLKDSIEIDYNTGLTEVKIVFDDTNVVFEFKDGICRVTTQHKKSPIELLKAVAETQALLLASGSTTVPLLGP